MANPRAIALIVLLPLGLCLFPGVHLLGNSWSLLVSNGYSIPRESSIVTFQCTEESSGSGEYCLFGSDWTTYYGMCETQAGRFPKCEGDFSAYPKKRTRSCRGFDPQDASTWCNLAAAAPSAREWMLTVITAANGETRLQQGSFPSQHRCEWARKSILSLIGPGTPDLDSAPQANCERVKT
jgi:hypothetical protein